MGLRQGDIPSPFLFLLAIEGLNIMMNGSVKAGRRGSPPVISWKW